MTNDIERRIQEHKSKTVEGFTARYNINRLVWYERFHYVGNAIAREKQIKDWRREKKVALIEKSESHVARLVGGLGKKPGEIRIPDEIVFSDEFAPILAESIRQVFGMHGAVGGRSRSNAKVKAARRNGSKGGRPPRSKSKRRGSP